MTLICLTPTAELELWTRAEYGSWDIVCSSIAPKWWDVVFYIKFSGSRPEFFGRMVLGKL